MDDLKKDNLEFGFIVVRKPNGRIKYYDCNMINEELVDKYKNLVESQVKEYIDFFGEDMKDDMWECRGNFVYSNGKVSINTGYGLGVMFLE